MGLRLWTPPHGGPCPRQAFRSTQGRTFYSQGAGHWWGPHRAHGLGEAAQQGCHVTGPVSSGQKGVWAAGHVAE